MHFPPGILAQALHHALEHLRLGWVHGKDSCSTLRAKKISLPNHSAVKKVGGGEGKGSFLVSTGTNYTSGTLMEIFFPSSR